MKGWELGGRLVVLLHWRILRIRIMHCEVKGGVRARQEGIGRRTHLDRSKAPILVHVSKMCLKLQKCFAVRGSNTRWFSTKRDTRIDQVLGLGWRWAEWGLCQSPKCHSSTHQPTASTRSCYCTKFIWNSDPKSECHSHACARGLSYSPSERNTKFKVFIESKFFLSWYWEPNGSSRPQGSSELSGKMNGHLASVYFPLLFPPTGVQINYYYMYS